MTVAAYHAPVKSDVINGICRHKFKLGREKISFNNAVFFIKQRKKVKLDSLAFIVVFKRTRADYNIKLLALYDFICLALHLFAAEMGENVGDAELRLIRFFTDFNIDKTAVSLANSAMQRKRNCCPLIFFDSAVVVGFEISHAVLLVNRALFQIKARRVNVSGGNSYAVLNASFAFNAKNDCLASVCVINFVACVECAAEFVKFNKSVFLRNILNISGNLTLCFVSAQKFLISLAKFIAGVQFVLGENINAVFLLVKQHFF